MYLFIFLLKIKDYLSKFKKNQEINKKKIYFKIKPTELFHILIN